MAHLHRSSDLSASSRRWQSTTPDPVPSWPDSPFDRSSLRSSTTQQQFPLGAAPPDPSRRDAHVSMGPHRHLSLSDAVPSQSPFSTQSTHVPVGATLQRPPCVADPPRAQTMYVSVGADPIEAVLRPMYPGWKGPLPLSRIATFISSASDPCEEWTTIYRTLREFPHAQQTLVRELLNCLPPLMDKAVSTDGISDEEDYSAAFDRASATYKFSKLVYAYALRLESTSPVFFSHSRRSNSLRSVL